MTPESSEENKGNATKDLKPVDTLSITDYDLYFSTKRERDDIEVTLLTLYDLLVHCKWSNNRSGAKFAEFTLRITRVRCFIECNHYI